MMARKAAAREESTRQKCFSWKPGLRMRIEPQPAGERMDELRAVKARALRRKDIYEDAVDPNSPFYQEVFADAPADAEKKWRLEVCGRILRGLTYTIVSVQVTETGDSAPIEIEIPNVTYVRGVGYELTSTAATSREMQISIMHEILLAIRQYRKKLHLFQGGPNPDGGSPNWEGVFAHFTAIEDEVNKLIQANQ